MRQRRGGELRYSIAGGPGSQRAGSIKERHLLSVRDGTEARAYRRGKRNCLTYRRWVTRRRQYHRTGSLGDLLGQNGGSTSAKVRIAGIDSRHGA